MLRFVRWVVPAAPLCVLAAAMFMQTSALTQDSGEELPVPRHWVPFSATYEESVPNARSVLGSFYRGADGSTRLESGPDDGTVRVIDIHNVTVARYYRFSAKTGIWISGPMRLPPNGYRPPRVKAHTATLSTYRWKLGLRMGQGRLLQAAAGFDAVQQVEPDGMLKLFVPELGFFPIVVQWPDGRRRLFADVVIGDQPSALFIPDAGANVEEVFIPDGIVTMDAPR